MTHQAMKPPTVVKLTNQPKTVLAPLETVMKDKTENKDYPLAVLIGNPQYTGKCKTHTGSDRNERKPRFRNSAEDLRGLTANRKTEQDTGGRVQIATARGKGAGEDGGINEMRENLNSGAVDGDDIWAEGGW
jgi:hypothetical protein